MSMEISITIDERKLKQLIQDHIQEVLGEVTFDHTEITIEVKSKQNWKSEWEAADFRAVLRKFT